MTSRARRGMTIIVVLAMVAVTMAMSYAILRSQATSSLIQSNIGREGNARQAAMAGLSTAIRKMHESNWAGADSSFTGTLGTYDGFSVTYESGDALLTATDPNYAEYPYRVTVTSTGYSKDPSNISVRTTHRIQAVVQLVRRKLSSDPTNWATLNQYTVYQWANSAVKIQPPARVEGPVYLQGALQLCPDYPGDCRPFYGRIDEVTIYNSAISDLDMVLMNLLGNSGLSTLLSTILGKSPYAWWRLNDAASSTTAADSSGNGRSGTYRGATPGAGGILLSGNTSASFSSGGDYVEASSVPLSGNKFSVTAWIYVDQYTGVWQRIVSKSYGTDDNQHEWMLGLAPVGNSNRLVFRLKTGGVTDTLIASSGNVPVGTWVLVGATYDGFKMEIFQSGSQVGSQFKSGNISAGVGISTFIGDNFPGSPRLRWLADMESKRAAGGADYRPLSGTVNMPTANSSSENLAAARTALKLTVNNIAASNTAPLTYPSTATSYKLFPGGKSFTIPTISANLLGATYVPDPKTNPLGVYSLDQKLQICDNTTIRGTILVSNSSAGIHICGQNVTIAPYTLPAVEGSSTSVQMPTAISKGDVLIEDEASGSIQGMVVTWDALEFEQGPAAQQFSVQGKVLAAKLRMGGRSEFAQTANDGWVSRLRAFASQLADANPVTNFNDWILQQHQLDSTPKIVIKPTTETVSYHWQDFSQPVYIAHPSDGGLRWNLIRMTDNP